MWLYFIRHGSICIGRAFPPSPGQELSRLYCESWFNLCLFLTIQTKNSNQYSCQCILLQSEPPAPAATVESRSLQPLPR